VKVSKRKNRPPHGPLVVEAGKEGRHMVWCLACRLRGPEREDKWEAKLAFEETIQ
jgi:hypothetical protein